MVLYFSGTGSSRFAAEKIAETAGDKIVSVNEIIKSGGQTDFESEKPYVFVLPVYAGRMPRVVESCIETMTLKGSNQAYFIMTCSKTPYQAEKYIRKLCTRKHIDLLGFNYICMPQNYITMFNVPDHEQAVEIYRHALPDISRIAGLIKNRMRFDNVVNGGRMMSDIVNPLFYKLIISAKGFRTNSNCIGCGVCVKLCPLNNIKLSGATPEWGRKCTHCMACINGCPEQAVEYKKSTAGKTRNYNVGAELQSQRGENHNG